MLKLTSTGQLLGADPLEEVIEYDPARVDQPWEDADEREFPGEDLDLNDTESGGGPPNPDETPWAKLSHVQQRRVLKDVIAILNDMNEQLEVKRSTIKGIAKDSSAGVFAKKRLRKALVIGTYRGKDSGKDQYDLDHPGNRPRYVLETKRNVFIDATDPRTASMGRFINDPGPSRKPNVAFVLSRGKILIQTLRLIMPGEELFVSYGPEFGWLDGERLSAPTDRDASTLAEVGGVPLESLVHPRLDTTPAEAVTVKPADSTLLEAGHADYEADSLVLYANEDGSSWLVGSVMAVDLSRPLIEIHRYGSLDVIKGKALSASKFRPAFVDPRDGKQVFTQKPLSRYAPVFDIIEFSEVLVRDFYLTNQDRLPDRVVRHIQSMSS